MRGCGRSETDARPAKIDPELSLVEGGSRRPDILLECDHTETDGPAWSLCRSYAKRIPPVAKYGDSWKNALAD